MKPLRLAADTNVLLDVALQVEAVLDCLDVLDKRLPRAERFVPPSVLDELAYLADSGETKDVRKSALAAIRQLREEHRFRPILKLPIPTANVEDLATRKSWRPKFANAGCCLRKKSTTP